MHRGSKNNATSLSCCVFSLNFFCVKYLFIFFALAQNADLEFVVLAK